MRNVQPRNQGIDSISTTPDRQAQPEKKGPTGDSGIGDPLHLTFQNFDHFRRHRVLALNPGSTSTKIAVYEGELERFTEEIQHSAAELAPFEGKRIVEQYELRKNVVLDKLAEHGIGVADLELGEGLSPGVEAALPTVIEIVAGLVEEHLSA